MRMFVGHHIRAQRTFTIRLQPIAEIVREGSGVTHVATVLDLYEQLIEVGALSDQRGGCGSNVGVNRAILRARSDCRIVHHTGHR